MPKQFMVLPYEEVTDPATGELIGQPKYMDTNGVSGFSGQLVDVSGTGFPGTTNADGEAYIAQVEATDAALDQAEGLSDVWTIGSEASDDVTPSQAANFLNEQLRPQTFEELKARMNDYKDLTADEWAKQLTGNETTSFNRRS